MELREEERDPEDNLSLELWENSKTNSPIR